MDSLQRKSQLDTELGPRQEEYYAALNKFLRARIAKCELDYQILQILGKDKIYLHNELILAIVNNAASGDPPPKPSRKKAPPKKPAKPVVPKTKTKKTPTVRGMGPHTLGNSSFVALVVYQSSVGDVRIL